MAVFLAKALGKAGLREPMAWADPEEQIYYVFLFNRAYPTANNTLLLTSYFESLLNIFRTPMVPNLVHEVLYPCVSIVYASKNNTLALRVWRPPSC